MHKFVKIPGMALSLLSLAGLLLTGACAGTPTPTTTPMPSTGTTSTPSVPTTPTTSPTTSVALEVTDFVTGLDVPWEMAFAPDGRIFVTERPGQIRIVKDGQLQSAPWMTLEVAATGEGGLLGLALDPAFADNHYVYVAYTYRNAHGQLKNRLVRLKEDSSGKGVMDKILLDGAAGNSIHDGGRVKFGPDGKLYWTLGEAGDQPLAQDLSSLNGKIIRINADGTIPADNPFPGSPVYSYGHRNPEGLAWQPGTGRLYATEHGPSGGLQGSGQDEVNYIEPGKNYGWPAIHGDQTRAGMVSPLIQSGGSETWAPAGAVFAAGGLQALGLTRAEAEPSGRDLQAEPSGRGPWDGSFVFAGLRGESLYRLVPDKNDPRRVVTFEKYLVGQFGRLRDVVQGPDGALYILTNNTDGRGSPRPGDDRILRLTFK